MNVKAPVNVKINIIGFLGREFMYLKDWKYCSLGFIISLFNLSCIHPYLIPNLLFFPSSPPLPSLAPLFAFLSSSFFFQQLPSPSLFLRSSLFPLPSLFSRTDTCHWGFCTDNYSQINCASTPGLQGNSTWGGEAETEKEEGRMVKQWKQGGLKGVRMWSLFNDITDKWPCHPFIADKVMTWNDLI